MKKKQLIYAFLAIVAIASAYWFFMTKKERILQAKYLIFLNRQPLAGNETDFIIKGDDSLSVITEKDKISLFNEMKQIRGMNIVKTQYLAKLVTSDNDTTDILILLPGCFVVNQKNKKTYGFKDRDKQRELYSLFFGEK